MTIKSHLLSIAAISLALGACTSGEEKKAVEVEQLPIVKTAKVYAEEVPQIINYTATVEPFKTNNITSNTPNRIKEIKVDIGHQVTA